MTTPAGWHRDPMGRHEQRYWDGTSWTDHVADGGDAGIDRLDGSSRPLDETWAERVEDAPQDATTIVPSASAEPAGPWQRFRALSRATQAFVAGVTVVTLFAVGASATGAPPAEEAVEESSTTTTIARIPEVTSPPETTAPPTTTTTAAPTTTTTVAPTTTTTTAPPPTTTTARPAPATVVTAPRPSVTSTLPPVQTTSAPAPASTGDCHPSYQRTCIPPGPDDVDCRPGSGNGPRYVDDDDFAVVGPDQYGLDSDNDGIGCES